MKKNLSKVITAIQRLGLQPGTILVVKVQSRADADMAMDIIGRLKEKGSIPKGYPVCVVPASWSLLEINLDVAKNVAAAEAAKKSRLILP